MYPPEHEELAVAMARRGAVVTEFAPGVEPLPQHFPLRNRIISGLVRVLVVVEAAERSGSLITARLALEQGREVMAVPGPVLSGRNRGAHALIRDGAKLVEIVDDILDEFPDLTPVRPESIPGPDVPVETDLTAAMQPGEPCSVDELASRTGLEPGRLLAGLLELELAGRVSRAGGGRFILASRKW
jgi:DNA processing protein